MVIIAVRIGKMPWAKLGATHYNAQLELLDKGLAIKVLIVLRT